MKIRQRSSKTWKSTRLDTMYHATCVENIWSICAEMEKPEGGLNASEDEEAGQRYNRGVKGVYCHASEDKGRCDGYGHHSPVFGNGVYVYITLELVVNKAHSIPLPGSNGSQGNRQKVQKPNSWVVNDINRAQALLMGGPSIWIRRMHVQVLR